MNKHYTVYSLNYQAERMYILGQIVSEVLIYTLDLLQARTPFQDPYFHRTCIKQKSAHNYSHLQACFIDTQTTTQSAHFRSFGETQTAFYHWIHMKRCWFT